MTAIAPLASEPTAPRRAWSATLWTVQVVTAVGFLLAALAKLTGAEVTVATFNAIGFGDWFRYVVAALEVAGALALLVPRLAGLAGLAFVGLMVGAVLAQLLAVGSGVLLPLPFLVLSAVIAWGRRRSTAELWRLVARR